MFSRLACSKYDKQEPTDSNFSNEYEYDTNIKFLTEYEPNTNTITNFQFS